MLKLPKKINLRDPKVFHPLLIILAGGLVAYFIYAKMIVPTQQNLTRLYDEEKTKRTELNKLLAMKTRFGVLQREVELAGHKLDSLREIFPDQKEIPKLIQEITKVSRASNITTRTFIPQPDVVREYYVENHFSLSVEGGYHDLAEFFSFLANLPLIINLSKMNMGTSPGWRPRQEGEERDEAMDKSVRATFEMTTFSSKK